MLTFKVPVEFKIGDTVYIKNEPEQKRYTVLKLLCSEHDVQYALRNGESWDYFYGFELSTEEDTNYRINKS